MRLFMYAYQVPPSTMSGRSVAQNKRGAVGRPFMAAELVTGRVRLSRLTVTQAALILKVNRTYVHAALAVGHDPIKRAAILRGCEQLVAPPAPKPVPESLAAISAMAVLMAALRCANYCRRNLIMMRRPRRALSRRAMALMFISARTVMSSPTRAVACRRESMFAGPAVIQSRLMRCCLMAAVTGRCRSRSI
jgi:hypothetical protein